MANILLNRRNFIKMMSLGATTMVIPRRKSAAQQFNNKESHAKPNIVFIMADDMGYGDLGCYNKASKIPTPNMDHLAAQGIRFTDAHTPAAVCTPTRYSVLTGRYCWRIQCAGHWSGYNEPLIETERLTIASLLKKHGYATACIGKWHVGMRWSTKDGHKPYIDGRNVDHSKPIRGGPVDLGFDYYYGIGGCNNLAPYCFIENNHTVGIPSIWKKPLFQGQLKGLTVPDWKDDQIGPILTRKAVEFIRQHHKQNPGQPFFLYLATLAAHTPCVPPEFIKGHSQAGRRGDMVAEVDWSVGEVIKTLKQLNLSDNTLLIVTSDNGALLGDVISPAGSELKFNTYGHRSCGDLRGQKADIWEGGHRAPFIARWPSKIRAGSKSEEVICLTDLMATFSAIIGAELPDGAGEDSYNILPALSEQKNHSPIREAIVHISSRDVFAIRQGQWKLILGRGSGGISQPKFIEPKPGEPQGQLYDMDNDIKENNNLWAQHPEIINCLTELLEKYKQQGYSRPLKGSSEPSAQDD